MKWERNRRGAWSLTDDEGQVGIVEPSRCRGWWWWSTWGLDDDKAGIIYSFREAKLSVMDAIESEAAR